MSHWSVILGLISSHLNGTKVLIYSWWSHVVTCFDLTILESSISIILRCFLVSRWEPIDIVIYFGILYSCSLRTDGYVVIYHWCLQLLIENCCDHYDYHLMLFSCSWRIDVIIVDYLLVLSKRSYRIEVILWFMNPWA